MLAHGLIGTLDDNCSTGVAKDKVAVTITEAHMTGTDFRVHHQYRTRLTQLHGTGCILNTKGGRRTGNVHIKTKTIDTQCFLHLYRQCRIASRQIGASHNNRANVLRAATSRFERLFGRFHSHFCENRRFVIGAGRDARRHDFRVQHRSLGHYKAAFDARGFFNKGRIGIGQGVFGACFNLGCVIVIPFIDIGVETFDQFIIGYAVFGGPETSGGDYGCHELSSLDRFPCGRCVGNPDSLCYARPQGWPQALIGLGLDHPLVATIRIGVAVDPVVIDHADGLHEGIDDDGADEFEPAVFQVF